MQEMPHSDRLAERSPVLLNARCRKSSWLVSQVEVSDISQGGCCLVGSADNLSVGQQVILRFAGKPGFLGTVRWIRGDDAGIEFLVAADDDVIAEIARIYAPDASNVTDIRKYLGRG